MTEEQFLTPFIVSLLTPHGRGAVASIGLHGPAELLDGPASSLFTAVNGQPVATQPIDRILFGHWGSAPGEEVVVCRTDHDQTEIHCHGGAAAARRILTDLERIGCRVVSWHELQRGQLGQFEAECREALTRAPTLRTAGIMLEQTAGTLRTTVEGISAALEHHDYESAQTRISALLDWAEFGRHLTEPWQVVIVGRPNVGKSSLLNALAGFQRAIVFDQPGTTRDVVTAEIALDGWPVTLIDTAGIRHTDSALESAGINLARYQAGRADLRIVVLDSSQTPRSEDFELLAEWSDAVVVANKADFPDGWQNQMPTGSDFVSTVTGAGIESLAGRLGQRLVPHVPVTGTAIPLVKRQVELLLLAQNRALAGEWLDCDELIREISCRVAKNL